MVKKPFSIRVEQHVINSYRAMSTVLNIDGAKLLSELITSREGALTPEEYTAYKALLNLWKDKE